MPDAPGTHEIGIGARVRVLPAFDIPPMFRGGKPSEGVVERIEDGAAVVIVDGKAVPYSVEELEPV